MKRTFWVVLLMAMLIAGVGCGEKNKLVGTWQMSGAPIPMVTRFDANGQYRLESKEYGNSAKKLLKGTYSIAGDVLSQNVTFADIAGAPTKTARAFHAEVAKEIGKTRTCQIKWINEDEFEAKIGGQAVLFRRQGTD